MFFKIGFLKNFAIFTKKHPVLESLFNKAADLKAFEFFKNRLQHKCFSVNIAKFLRSYFYGTPPVAASDNGKLHFQCSVNKIIHT